MELFLPLAGGAAVLGLGLWWMHRVDHRRRNPGPETTAICRAGLRWGDGRLRWGRLHLSPSWPVWRRLDEEVELRGAALLASSAPLHGDDRPAELLLQLRDGQAVHLHLPSGKARELARLLADVREPAHPGPDSSPSAWRRPPRGWGATTVVAAGVLYVGCYVLMALTGYSAMATVTGGDGEGFCEVRWEDHTGRPHDGESDCSDEAAGSTIDVLVSGRPFPGDPITPGGFVLEMLVVGVPLCGLGGARLWVLRRRLATWARELQPASSPRPAPAVRAAALVPATSVALARRARRTAAFFVAGALSLTGFVVAASLVFDQSEELRRFGEQAVGTVEELHPDDGLTTGSALVRYDVAGAERHETVALGSNVDFYAEGQTVTVYYDPAEPDRMTIDDEDNQPSWSVLPMVLALVGGLTVVGFAAHRWVRGLIVERLLWNGSWHPVRVEIEHDRTGIVVTADDGSVWRSRTWAVWDTRNRLPSRSADRLPPAGTEPVDTPGQSAWCVTDGARAVFSPDRGAPLVLTRRERHSSSSALGRSSR